MRAPFNGVRRIEPMSSANVDALSLYNFCWIYFPERPIESRSERKADTVTPNNPSM